MPLIDDRGRLFGKVNLIDAAVGLLFLLLIPLGYGAYVLFRTPAPQITAVEPATLNEGKDLRVQLRGKNLRPFLRVSIGTQSAKGFLVESPDLAEVKLPDLGAGTYDLVLYDEAQEVARRPGALTIVPPLPPLPPPSVVVQVLGAFTGLDKEGARALAVGARFAEGGQPPLAEVLALQPPEPAVERVRVGGSTIITTPVEGKVQVPAILRLRCTLVPEGCKAGDALVAPGATLRFPRPGGGVPFVVEEIRPDTKRKVAEVLIRFLVRPEILSLVKVGDVGQATSAAVEKEIATLIALKEKQELPSRTRIDVGIGVTEVEEKLTAIEAVLRVAVQETPAGWQYKARPVKVGAAFTFETSLYTMRGWILWITAPPLPLDRSGEAIR